MKRTILPQYLLNPAIRVTAPLTLAVALLAAGCGRDEVKVYQVSKDQSAPPATPAAGDNSSANAMPPGHPDVSGSMSDAGIPMTRPATPQLSYTKPAAWTEVPPSTMRVASFKVAGPDGKDVDISVIPLPGLAGSDEANVNRWRGQLGLEALSPEDLQKAAETVDVGGQPGALYDIVNPNDNNAPVRIIAVIQRRDDTAWFYKMMGDATLVEQQKPAMVEFLKSIKFSAAATTPDQMSSGMPEGHPAVGGSPLMETDANAPISHEGQPNWQAPADWKEVGGGQFLLAKFLIHDANGAAAVNVSKSAGDGGGVDANVSRWRGQLGLGAGGNTAPTPLEVTSGQAQVVDLLGTSMQTGQPARLIGVIVTQADQTWFYKLMGDAKTVADQKEAFLKFVQGAKY